MDRPQDSVNFIVEDEGRPMWVKIYLQTRLTFGS